MDFRNTNRIIFHNDLDGISCAAIFLNMLGKNDKYILHPVKTQIRGEKFERMVDKFPKDDIIIVLDYQYHKRAHIWIDHHYSEIAPKEPNKRFINKTNSPSAFAIISPAHPSACMINMIDGCKYPSVEYIFESDDPAMTLNRFIKNTFPHDMIYCRIAEVLAATNLNFQDTIDILDVNVQEMIDKDQEGCENIKNFMCIHEGVIAVTHLIRNNEYPRYSEFYVRKNLDYMIRQVPTGNGKCQVEIGFNPFSRSENTINIGKFMSESKIPLIGGGHQNVGGCTLMESNAEDFISEFLKLLINEDGEMEKYAVDPTDKIEIEAQELVKEGSCKTIDDAREKVVIKNDEEVVNGSDAELKL